MFELVQALEDGAEVLKARSANPISLTAGCELFIAFVTLFPHESEARLLRRSSTVALYLTARPAGLYRAEDRACEPRPRLCHRGPWLSGEDRESRALVHQG
jgi:hypothetical protein